MKKLDYDYCHAGPSPGMDEPEMGVGGFHQHSTISKARDSWSAQNTNPCHHVLNTPLRLSPRISLGK